MLAARSKASLINPHKRPARSILVRSIPFLMLIAAVPLGSDTAIASDGIQPCESLPAVVKLGEPKLPDVEPRGLPNPVVVTVEFTLAKDGRVSDAVATDIDATGRLKEFETRAVQAVNATRFEPGPRICRGRIRIAFKLVGSG